MGRQEKVCVSKDSWKRPFLQSTKSKQVNRRYTMVGLFVCFVHQVGLHSTGSHDGRYPHQLHRSVGSGFVGGHHLYRYPMAVQETATARG